MNTHIDPVSSPTYDHLFPEEMVSRGPSWGVTLSLQGHPSEIAAAALFRLWKEQELPGEPQIFRVAQYRSLDKEHHPLLLDQLVAQGQHARPRLGQLTEWKRLTSPPYAYSVVRVPHSGELLTPDLRQDASHGERHPVPDASTGWIRYRFSSDWSALSVRCLDTNGGTFVLAAVPANRLGEWQLFLQRLDGIYKGMLRDRLRGSIQIFGGDDALEAVIRTSTFENVILPSEVLTQVAAQRAIFEKPVLARYAQLGIPRLRKALLIGAPGTGKTSLLKAEGSRHSKRGGLVFYVAAPDRGSHSSAWGYLSAALSAAAESKLPTLVLVEDFELFVSDADELQRVLNTLDGVATPDNPAGTLLLATSNHPERLEQRIRDRPGRVDVIIEVGLVEDVDLAVRFLRHFLGSSYREEEHARFAGELLHQPGSHFREVCLSASMLALGQERTEVLAQDLLAAHKSILTGRSGCSAPERMPLPSANQ